MNDDITYEPRLSFPDQSESFVLGFEAGVIQQKMIYREAIDGQPVHRANMEVLSRMASVNEYTIFFEDTNIEEWVYLDAAHSSSGPLPKKSRRSHLTVVK